MKSPLKHQNSKKSIIGLVSLGVLIIIGFLVYQNIQLKNKLHSSEEDTNYSSTKFTDIEESIEAFNPNDYTKKDWIALGFSDKQVSTILKYKKSLGGQFHSKKEIQDCYVISEEKYEELEKFILLPEFSNDKTQTFNQNEYQPQSFSKNSYKNSKSKKRLNIKGKFNPNAYSQNDWEKLGFSEKQATSILKYKNNYLHGKFSTLEEIKNCYMIDDEKFNQLKPYLLLPPEKPKEILKPYQEFSKINLPKKVTQLKKFNPNTLNKNDWMDLGFSEKQALSILKYKNNYLKGSFKSLDDVKNSYVISEEKFEELKPYIELSSKNNLITTNPKTPTKNVEKTNFKNIDLNSITLSQLMEFGFDKKAAHSFIGFRKALGGFMNKKQILDTYYIDKNLTQKLLDIASLNTKNVKKYTLVNAPKNWLKKHPYFKVPADKIIYYRTTFPDANKIWKFIKTPPQYREKMEWYLTD